MSSGSLADRLLAFVRQAEGHFFEGPGGLKTGRYANGAVAQHKLQCNVIFLFLWFWYSMAAKAASSSGLKNN
jgi:hypothetical protein